MNNLDLSRPVLIHVCQDRTISYRTKDEPVFNGVALPVYSVDTKEEAERLCFLSCTAQNRRHPHPAYPHDLWWAIPNIDGKQHLDLDDLDTVAHRLQERHAIMRASEALA